MTRFHDLYGRPATAAGDAPGRVNLIGEHTDYNGGFVLPTAIPQRTQVQLALRPDDQVRLATVDRRDAVDTRAYRLGAEQPAHDWADYLKGATALLTQQGLRLGGFDALITSAVPVGAGLSSSAALLVAFFRALRAAFALPLDDVRIARLSQEVENNFVGARVGIMDQMAASLADLGTALFLDTRDLSYRRVPLPSAAFELLVLDSGVKHSNAHGDYNTRRAECEAACQLLGVGQLRDLAPADLPALARLPDALRRRARHVITENARVLAAVPALETGDVHRLGSLFAASHASMRDDYEVSVKEVDLLVELAAAEPAVFGARLTGGGFGGSIVALCAPGAGRRTAARIVERYGRDSGRAGSVLVP